MILPITAALGLLTPPVHNAAPAWMYTDQLSVLKLDAVSLKGRGPAANPLLDVYVAMPYEHLQFTPYDGSFVGEYTCLLYTSPSPRDRQKSRMPSSA